MRVSTSLIFQRATNGMNEQHAELSKTQMQLASGKRMLSASDDPAAASRVLGLNKAIETVQQYQKNTDHLTERLEQEDTTISSVINLLQRANERAIQGGSGVLSPADRDVIAAELIQIADGVMNLANTRDAEGEYLFAGFQSKDPPFVRSTQSTFTYVGDQGQRNLQISADRRIADTDNGFDMFVDIDTGPYIEITGSVATTFDAIADGDLTINGINVGAIPPAANADERASQIVNAVNAVSDTTHVQAEMAASDQVRFFSSAGDISIGTPTAAPTVDTNTGLISGTRPVPYIEVTGVAATALTAIADGNLTINGTSVGAIPLALDAADRANQIFTAVNAIAGTTNVQAEMVGLDQVRLVSSAGDIVVATPTGNPAVDADTGFISATTSVETQRGLMDTLYQLADALDSDESINRYLNDMQLAMEHITSRQAMVGSRLNMLDEQSEMNASVQLLYEANLSAEQDLDYAEAIGRFNQQMIALQAAQQSYVKMQGLSLFNYL